jgi:hypothetical protein
MIEQEAKEKVAALTQNDWADLQDLYDRIVAHKGPFYVLTDEEYTADGALVMPSTIEEPIIRDVRRFFSDKHLIVPFDWGRWDEGRQLAKTAKEHQFAETKLEDIIKLYTAIVRNDRFVEGAFAEFFESGMAKLLLKRLLDFRPK